MQNKLEVLQSVKQNVSEHGIVACRYVDGDCYCAVGYLLKELGMTDAELLQLGNNSIEGIFEKKAPETTRELQQRVVALVSEVGFTKSELQELQEVNDDNEDADSSRVARYVDNMISNLSVA